MRAEAVSEHRAERAGARAAAQRAEPTTPRATPPAPVRGTHDVAELPIHAPRELGLWRRPGAAAPPRPAGAGRRRRGMQAKLRVGRPGDAYEREADAVAARVTGAHRPRERGRGPAPRALRRAQAHIRAPPRTRGPPPTSTVPDRVEAVVAAPSGGRPIDPDLRARIEPHVGADLASVRIRDGPDADAAASALGARAFAAGGAIFLAAGESPRDVALIAHEAAHVVQQDASPVARGRVLRQVAEAVEEPGLLESISDAALDLLRGGVRAIPGYEVLCTIAGVDLLTGRPALASREQLLELVLSWGPFGAAVGPVLRTIGVVDDVFAVVSEGLTAHDLTLARLEREVAAGWAELRVFASYEANLAAIRRRIDAVLRDVVAFVTAIAERVLALVRRAVAAVAAPLLEQPPIAPVWNLARKVLHYDPLLGRPVEASTVEILSDFLRLIGKEAALEQMSQRGTLQATADWIDTQLATFSGLLTDLGAVFSDAWAAIQPANLPQILDTLPQLASRAFGLLGRISDFAQTVIAKVLELIKDALLGWLSEYAHRIPGFHLLTVILERNPFTGEVVERTAENLIKGFVTLLPNGEATYEQLAQSGVIAEAAARIESAIATLGISWELMTGTFRGIWESLSLEDLLDPISAFVRVVERFGEPVARIVAFVGVVIETVVSLVLRLMNFPSDLLASIIANVQRALADIERDPIAFLLNLLEALKAGFLGFFERIGGYLLEGLTAWLFRGLGQLGIQIPADLSLPSILGLVLQVLGLSMETLWTKLAEHLGPERVAMIRGALDMLSGAWSFIVDVQERGLVAIWEYVSQQLSSLWDTLLGMATDWILTTIVTNVTARLISMLDPTGVMAVVNSFIAFFRAVQSAIEYLREILQIVDMYVSTVAAIAAGNIQPGAEMVERGLAAAIPIAIGFLATQVGIADIPEKIVELIGRLRELVDQAIDWLIEQAIRLGQGVLAALGVGGRQEPAPAGTPKQQAQQLLRQGLPQARTPEQIRELVTRVRDQLAPAGLTGLELRGPDAEGKYEIVGAASAFERLVEMIPVLGGRRAVVLEVTLDLHVPDVTLSGARREAARDPTGRIQVDESGRPVMVTTGYQLPPVIARGPRASSRVVSGGVALPPEPGAGRVQLLTYNTSEDPRADNNLSHAERQLEEFFDRNREIARQVREINAEINFSPCALCSSTLSDIAAATPRATRRSLRWHDLYVHPTRGTTDDSLRAIRGWTVIPGAVTEEGLTNLEVEAWTGVS